MAGYIGSKAVNLSTTGADINGDANIDGTLTTDGLTVDADNTNAPQVIFENSHSVTTDAAISTYDDAAGVGITLGSNYYLNSAGSEARFNTSEESAGILVDRTGVITLKTDNSGSAVAKDRLNIAGNGDISFYEDTGSTAKMVWSASAESLGIGGTPDKLVHLKTSVNNTAVLRIESTATDSYPHLSLKNDAREYQLTAHGPLGDVFTIYDGTAGSHRFVISSSGNVGIGTSSPVSTLTLPNDGMISWASTACNIQATSSGADYIKFTTNGSERMRIDSSGNVLVAKTNTDRQTVGHEQRPDGFVRHTKDGGNPLELTRLSSDGDLAKFYKDGSTVGSIGVAGSDFTISGVGTTSGIYFNANGLIPLLGGNLSDNTEDIGQADYRWDDIYATNGTIQTSDRNEKQDIAELSDAEQRVAVACKGLLRKFRWRDAVAEKGDEARTHFGIIAQDLQAAFAAEGLDAGDYAMFISSTWTDEETGEERTRMGVRYSELLAFIIGAL